MIINSRCAIRRLRNAALLGAALTVVVAQPSLAATATSSLSSTATVTSNCTVSTTAVAFGNVNVTTGAAVDQTGAFSTTCTSGTAWTAAADVGAGGTGATITTRKMTSGTNKLNYALYTEATRTTVFGDGTAGNGSTIADTGTGSAVSTTIYGRVLSSQNTVPAGSYSDTVTITVTYT